MPLFYQQDINQHTRLAVWHIQEPESFFHVPLQRTITHPHKRLQHLAGRYLLKFLFPDFPQEQIIVADTRKPFLPQEQYHFSISHCGDYAAAIVSATGRVGIDIEVPAEKVVKLVPKFLNQPEQLFLAAIAKAHDLLVPATLLWSAKEAMFKWWGSGKVDFRQMLLLEEFIYATEGTIPARFNHVQWQQNLLLHYRQFEELCLVFIGE
jgi:phosphopantetheinyl transferase